MRGRRGFTLWEMSMVLLLMAVAALLVAPAAARLGRERPRTGADALLELLRAARQTAIERNSLVTLRIDPVSGDFRADTSGAAGSGKLAEGTLDLGTTERLVTELPRLQYVFRATGAAFADSVLVRGADGAFLVAVDPWSGVARADPR